MHERLNAWRYTHGGSARNLNWNAKVFINCLVFWTARCTALIPVESRKSCPTKSYRQVVELVATVLSQVLDDAACPLPFTASSIHAKPSLPPLQTLLIAMPLSRRALFPRPSTSLPSPSHSSPHLRRFLRKLSRALNQNPTIPISIITTLILLLLILTTARLSTPPPPPPPPPTFPFLLGLSKLDITPTERVWLSGFESRNRTVDHLTPLDPSIPLYARAISLRTKFPPSSPLIIIALDLIGLHRDLSLSIYNALQTQFGLSRAQVRLVTSHTHSGPVVGRNLAPLVPDDTVEWEKIHRYADILQRNVVHLVSDILSQDKLTSVSPHFARVGAPLAVNRLDVLEQEFDGMRRGDTDHDVPVLWFSGENGAVVAGMYGYSAHATVLTNEYRYSGDYPGLTSAILEDKMQGSTWLFLTGCGGDQNIYPRGTIDLLQKHSNDLAEVISDSVLGGTPQNTDQGMRDTLAFMHNDIPLPFQSRLSRRDLRQLTRNTHTFGQRAAETLMQQTESDGKTPANYSYPITAANIAGVRFAFLGGEPTVAYCHSLRSHGADWVVGYTDDVMGYVPTDELLASNFRGKFERAALYYGLPSVWKAGTEGIILAEAERLLQQATSMTKT